MKAAIGDELTVKGRHQGDVDRHGEIIGVHGSDGSPPYVVRWKDGHESVFYPYADTLIEHRKTRKQAARR
jgi:Domain of unknown function (DUF1918)